VSNYTRALSSYTRLYLAMALGSIWKQSQDERKPSTSENDNESEQANSHGAGVSECGGCGNSEPDKRCLGCLHDFVSRRDNKAGVEPNESN